MMICVWQVRALRKQLRKSHEEVMVGQQRLGELQDELRRLTDTNHKLERVVGKKKLLERDQLTVQLEEMRQQLTNREKRVAVRLTLVALPRVLSIYSPHRSWRGDWRPVIKHTRKR